MAGIELRILGGFALRRESTPVSRLPGRKARALLAYLALSESRLQTREHLASLLWGDRQDEQARQSLRQAVSSLRKALGDDAGELLISEGDGLRLDSADLTVDALHFERAVLEGSAESLRTGMAFFQGDLLASLGSVCEEFDRWLSTERVRYRNLAANALERLAASRDYGPEDEAAVALAACLLKLDPLCEPAHRALMRHYHGSGQRTMAVHQYKQLSDLLRRELDLEPEPETRQLLEHIQSAPPSDTAERSNAGRRGGAMLRSARRLPRPALFAGGALLLLLAASGAYLAVAPRLAPPYQEAGVTPRPPASQGETSIAILPFETATEGEREHALAFGLVQGITTALSMISDLSVVSGTSGSAERRDTPHAVHSNADAGARYVLEGSIQLAERSVRITATLKDTVERRKLWTQLYHRPVGDIFSLQNEIILSLVTALQIELSEGEQARISLISGTENLEAWLLAGRALQEVRRLTPERIIRARALYEQALRLDPDYTGAKGGLAWTYLIELLFGWESDIEPSIETAAALGKELAGNPLSKAGGYGILSWVELFRGNHARAVRLGEKAIAANPAGADYIAQFAFVLTFTGNPKRAVTLMKRALSLSPSPPDWFYWNLGRAHRLAGRHGKALAILQRADADPVSPLYLVELTAALSAAGREAEARETAKRLLALRPEFSVRRWVRLPPYKDPVTARRNLELLTGAGLPQ